MKKSKKICVYIMTSDDGDAPKFKKNICSLKGCMEHNIEKSAQNGDWIVGIGGKTIGKTKENKGKYDRKLIYAMKVEKNESNEPQSKNFYHFGEEAVDFPDELKELFYKRIKYFFHNENPNIFSNFENFIRRFKKGRIGSFCDKKTNNCLANSLCK